jgi:hypothetical protein
VSLSAAETSAGSTGAARIGRRILSWVPASIKGLIPVALKARGRALLGVEPWPDLSVRHPLFREARYRALRREAARFDLKKPNKPVLERGHQTSYLIARWLAEAGVKSAFQVGYANGRYLFYLSRMGIECGGTDLPPRDTEWRVIPPAALDAPVRSRLLEVDFFDLTPSQVLAGCGAGRAHPLDVLFTEATFETLLPWRESGVSVSKYAALRREELAGLLQEKLPAKLADLEPCVRNVLLIEPEPRAGGAGLVFEACARRVPGLRYSVWRFRPPFDRLFRLSPSFPAEQAVYAYVRDSRVTEALGAYAERTA